jgi:quinol monooxygenase YgiN
MMNSNTFIFAKITPKKEFFESAKSELLSMLEATRSEEGCIKFELHESECANYIYLYEEWLNKVALENHHNQEHTKVVAAKFEHWLDAPTEVSFMKKI